MQPAAKKCLWWAGASVTFAVACQFVLSLVPWMWPSALTSSYMLPGWFTVASSIAAVAANVAYPLAAVLIGVAVLINVLIPRIGTSPVAGSASSTSDDPEDVIVANRRDAPGIADTSAHEPPAR